MNLLGRSNKHGLEDLSELYNECRDRVSVNTPEGWNAKVVTMTDGIHYCYAETSLEGVLATIPVMIRTWSHAGLIKGFFGYEMIGGHPWRKNMAHDRESGARIAMRWSDGRTSINVYSHPSHYEEAMDLAQSIVDRARSGYLRLAPEESAAAVPM